MPATTSDFAILAPVPLEHLQSGQAIAEETGFVAYGSRKWELFRGIEERRQGAPVLVLIYPSHEDEVSSSSFTVSWTGVYIGCEETSTGRHSAGMRHRPPTTDAYPADNQGHWAVFWHVRELAPLGPGETFPIGSVQTVAGGWRKDAPPRGPELVAVPSTLELPHFL